LIDDMARNTLGAAAFGMRSILFGTDGHQAGADATLTKWADLPEVLDELEACET
jgi:FMN phosphatase YigB (HAD superfamily)